MLEQGPDKGGGKIGERLVMRLWHEQTVSGEKRPVIQKGQGDAIFKDDRGLFLTADDSTERAQLAVVWFADWSIWHTSPLLIIHEFDGTPGSAGSVMMPWSPLTRYNMQIFP